MELPHFAGIIMWIVRQTRVNVKCSEEDEGEEKEEDE